MFTQLISFKNPTIRQKAAEYLRLILARYPKEALLKDIDHIEYFLQTTLIDASEEARRSARLAWYEYERAFPFRQARLYELLDY